MSGQDAPCSSNGRGVPGPEFRAAAFGDWVPRFAAASRALSGIVGAASGDEVAAYRGFFARHRPRAENLLMLHAYLCPGADEDEDAAALGRVASLLALPLSCGEIHAALLRLAPFSLGNGRCARALRMSRHLAAGGAPEGDRIWAEWAEADRDGARPPRRQFTRMPSVAPYVIQTFGSA